MRPKTRIEPFLKKIQEYWELVPDWRFGQFISNFLSTQQTDCFFWEEEEFLKRLENYFHPKEEAVKKSNLKKDI